MIGLADRTGESCANDVGWRRLHGKCSPVNWWSKTLGAKGKWSQPMPFREASVRSVHETLTIPAPWMAYRMAYHSSRVFSEFSLRSFHSCQVASCPDTRAVCTASCTSP